MYDLNGRVAHFPWAVKVSLGRLGTDVGGVEGIWAGIQMENSERPGQPFHVFQGIPLRPGLDPRRQARDALGLLLFHEVDEGLELEGRRVYEPHGKDRAMLQGAFAAVFNGGTF